MITKFRDVLNADMELVPIEMRAEFRQEMSFINIGRMNIVSWVILAANLVFIFTIDLLNLLNLPPKARFVAVCLHCGMVVIAGGVILLHRRYKSLNVQEMEPFHYYMGLILPSLILVFPTVLLYFITVYKGNPAGPYAAVLTLWAAGLMMEFRYALRIILANNAAFYGMLWIASSQISVNFGLEGFLSIELLTIATLIGLSLNFRKNAESFVQRKHIEHERNRIATLNDEIAAAYEEAEVLNNSLTNTLRALEHEQQTSERLLLNILPESIAERMKSGETTIAEHFGQVTVLFADIVGFTRLSATMKPTELVELLDRLFTDFDALAQQYGIEKIKTIGDAYMAVCGVPQASEQHVERVVRFALAMQRTVAGLGIPVASDIRVRIGIHTGDVVAGIIGKKKFSYDLWGDTVNTASRMESHGEAGKVHVSEEVYKAFIGHVSDINAPMTKGFLFEERGEIEIKGKGRMKTWYVSESVG